MTDKEGKLISGVKMKIQSEYEKQMNEIAEVLDVVFNGDAIGKDRKVGFMLSVFPFGDEGRFNYISNVADRKDMVCLMKEIIARFEGQPKISGNA